MIDKSFRHFIKKFAKTLVLLWVLKNPDKPVDSDFAQRMGELLENELNRLETK